MRPQEDTESLLGDRAYDTFNRKSEAQALQTGQKSKKFSWLSSLSLLSAFAVAMVVGFALSYQFTENSSALTTSSTSLKVGSKKVFDGKKSKKTTINGVTRPSYLKVDVYKHTSTISTGTYEAVATKTASYIAPLDSIVNLGCEDTYKVVLDIKHPGNENSLFSAIHFVDSTRFQVNGKAYGEWADYVESLGSDTFNVFMHQKLVMYVPDVAPLLRKLQSDNEFALYHLSKSPESSTYDVAHIGVPVSQAATIFEIVGPLTTLTATELELFTPWDEDETSCATSHSLKKALSEYQAFYEQMETTSVESAWTESTGLYVPMGVAIVTPTSSVDYMYDHLEAAALITGGTLTTEAISDTCTTLTLDISRDDEGVYGFNPPFVYVQNDGASQGGLFKLSAWEKEVDDSNSYWLSDYDTAGYQAWNHYLDHHFGLKSHIELSDQSYCANTRAYFEAVLDAYSIPFAPRLLNDSPAEMHYYSGYHGLRSWEFNAYGCDHDTYTWDVCGCLASNNNEEYKAIYNATCSVSKIVSTKK